jgi:hypothetical protein
MGEGAGSAAAEEMGVRENLAAAAAGLGFLRWADARPGILALC